MCSLPNQVTRRVEEKVLCFDDDNDNSDDDQFSDNDGNDGDSDAIGDHGDDDEDDGAARCLPGRWKV